ncbi:hypothetical protein [Bacillus smithii]
MTTLEKAIEQLKTEGYTNEQIHNALKIMLEEMSNGKKEESE